VYEVDFKQNPSLEWIDALSRKYPSDSTMTSVLNQKLKRRADGPYKPIDVVRLRLDLTRFLQHELQQDLEINDLRRMTGGASKEQFVFDLKIEEPTGASSSERFVLRLEPAESLVENSRLCEFQIMNAMQGTVPVPRARWVDPQGAAFGQPALIAQFVGGVTKPSATTLRNVSGVGTQFGPEWRPRLKRQFVERLVAIHDLDPRTVDLSAFAKPATGSTAWVESTLNWHDRVWEEDSVQEFPMLKVSSVWLRARMPILSKIAIVHGDYRQGNFMFDEGSGLITAILDWELAHLGDFHEDLGYMCQRPTTGSVDENGQHLICDLFTRSELFDLYEEISGRSVDRERVTYFEIMHLRKSAIVCLGTALRVVQGLKSHQDVLNAWLAPIGYSYLRELTDRLAEEAKL
jgi:aminoglycoside phosphotransferase (APT) family kinase protein